MPDDHITFTNSKNDGSKSGLDGKTKTDLATVETTVGDLNDIQPLTLHLRVGMKEAVKRDMEILLDQ